MKGYKGNDNPLLNDSHSREMLSKVVLSLVPVACALAILSPEAQDKQEDLVAEGSIDYPSYYHDHGHHHHHHEVSYVNDVAIKALLIPLAGVALLGAAAVAASNPVLLQIGILGGGILTGKKRKRRDISRIQQLQVIETFLGQLPRDEVINQERRLQAQYLQCSGIVGTNDLCFERITCELGKPKTNSTVLERNVLDIVTNDIMKNEFINQQFKFRLREARRIGLSSGNCNKYRCNQISL